MALMWRQCNLFLPRDRVRDAHKDLQSAFKKYDTRHKGFLTAIDVQKILIDFNYYLDDDQFYDLLQRSVVFLLITFDIIDKVRSIFQDDFYSMCS